MQRIIIPLEGRRGSVRKASKRRKESPLTGWGVQVGEWGGGEKKH